MSMEILEHLPPRSREPGKYAFWALFKCSFCEQIVEKYLYSKYNNSCGCMRNKQMCGPRVMKSEFKAENHHLWTGGKFIDANGYVRVYAPNHEHSDTKGYIKQHIQIAENILRKKLPLNAVIHHIDENKQNNENNNLVICQNDSYHHLIHDRKKAFYESGDANNLKCSCCNKWLTVNNFGTLQSRINRKHRSVCFECRKNVYKDMIKTETIDQRTVRLEKARKVAQRCREKRKGISCLNQ